MKKLLQHKFEKYKLDISQSKYEYVSYNKNEAIKDDSGIANEGSEYSYVNIPININIDISQEQIDYYRSKKESLLSAIENIDNDFSYFNKINDFSKDFFKYYHDKENKNLSVILEKSNINGEEIIEHHNKGYILNLNKDYEDNFLSKNMNLSFNQKDFLSHKSEFLENSSNRGLDWFLNDYDFSLGMKPIMENISYDESQNSRESMLAGFLIEKYNIDNTLLGKTFKSIDIKSRPNTTIKSFNIVVKDSKVKYGKGYKYLVYPVFLSTFPKKNDYHVVQEILVCDSPYVVDVSCKEFEKPEAPEKLFFTYLPSDSLILDWTPPYNIKNDIKGYYIFKRYSLEEPYKLIGVIDFTDVEGVFQVAETNIPSSIVKKYKNNIVTFEDNDFNASKISIYTVCSFDAHGNFSNYSEQISVVYDFTRKKLLKNLVSLSNAPLHLPNINIPRNIKFFGYQESIEDVVPIIKNKKKLTLYCTPDFVTLKNTDNSNEILLKENYVLNIFKMENQKSFSDVISVKNFKNINNE